MNSSNVRPEDWKRRSVNSLNNAGVLLEIKNISEEVAAHISIDTTTGDITFEQGASTAAANTTTGDNPQVGATPGVIDLSALLPKTFHSIKIAVNVTEDWECWLKGALPGDAPETSGTGVLTVETDLDCKPAAGAKVKLEEVNADFMCAGLTFNGPSSGPHNHDAQVLHEVLQITHDISYAGTATLKLFSVDDVEGTSTEIDDITVGASTVFTEFPSGGNIDEPIGGVDSFRLVVKFAAGTIHDLAANALTIRGRSYAHGPGLRESKLESSL